MSWPDETSGLDAENPWPGLDPFTEGGTRFFRGRDSEADDLLRYVTAERATLLYSRSGLGKTSVLQAGLFPRLRAQQFLPVDVRISYDENAPRAREQIYAAIERAARAGDVEPPPARQADSLSTHFHRSTSAFWAPRQVPVIPVLVFDQFEEIFTHGQLGTGNDWRAPDFARELIDLVEGQPPAELQEMLDAGQADSRDYIFSRHAYRVVICIREDFLGNFEYLSQHMPSIGVNRLRLEMLNGAQARLATLAGGPIIAADAVEPVVRMVAGDAKGDKPLDRLYVDPALLSLFLRSLNERRKVAGMDKITRSVVEGDRGAIFRRFSQAVVVQADPEVRRLIEERLVTPTGALARVTEENALSTPGVSREAIDSLVDARLIRRTERADRTLLELTHEVLTKSVAEGREERLSRSGTYAAVADKRHEHSKMEKAVYAILAVVALASGTLAFFAFCAGN